MDDAMLQHCLAFSTYTYPGLYQDLLVRDLPDDVRELGLLMRQNVIHRTTLAEGNVGSNADLRFGDMTRVPWWRQPEDDILVTAAAMFAELYRRDQRGLVHDRKPEDKLVLTCRFVHVMVASILKSKGIPARVRSGNAPYFDMGEVGKVSADHWIAQYWHAKESRWVTIDVDGSLSLDADFDPYDMPEGVFDFPADAWLAIRAGTDDPQRFWNALPIRGTIVILWSLFYDFHCIMNNECIYPHHPHCALPEVFEKLTSTELEQIDHLAQLMQKPDDNFDELKHIWETNKEFRLLEGGLL